MGAIEAQEKEALAQVAAFSVFFSIICFVSVFVIFMWGCYAVFSHFKRRGGGADFESTRFILADNKLMIILSYLGMGFYVLCLFCYLIANGALGVEYNSYNDTYGNSQIAAIIFWFFGHTLFYALYMVKLHHFIENTTYNMNKILQMTAFGFLIILWIISTIVMIVWIDEFHNHYHYGSANDKKIIACMVIAFAAHIWFCLSLVLFFSIVLYRVIQTKSTTLINSSSSSPTRSGKGGNLEEQVMEYMTRITVLTQSVLFMNIFCLLMWIILIGLEDNKGVGFLRFCWWLFPIDTVFSFMSIFLGLNYSPTMNDVYKKLCICPHAFCKYYCVKATMPSLSKRGVQIRDDDSDEDEDDDHHHNQLTMGNNRPKHSRDDRVSDDIDDEEDDDDEDDDDSQDEQDNLRGNTRHQFNPMSTNHNTVLTKAGE